jgi:hypothetical protein
VTTEIKKSHKISKCGPLLTPHRHCCSPRSITYRPTGLVRETKFILSPTEQLVPALIRESTELASSKCCTYSTKRLKMVTDAERNPLLHCIVRYNYVTLHGFFLWWRAPQQKLRTHRNPVMKIIRFFVLFPSNGAPVEWNWQGKTKVLGEKPVAVPLCPPQIPRGPTRATAVVPVLNSVTIVNYE